MGVHGLWRLLDATGKPVALETLEGKVLAVDVSIWLHQVMQGYQDGRGNPLPNAHLLGLFNRICKLLYYKIKPVFVFDGGVPLLKKNTIASRRKQKSVAASKAQRMKTDLINNLLKRTVVKGALGSNGDKQDSGETSAVLNAENRSVHSSLDLFKLPIIPSGNEFVSESEDEPDSDSDSSSPISPRKQAKWVGNIHSVDVSSEEFRALPPDVRHDILTDLKATRKQNSWGRLHEMPEQSHDFSNYQMRRLLKRRNVQECLEQAEKEMGGKTMTLEELDLLLTEQGIATTTKDNSSRIAADNQTRFIYINGIKKDGKDDAGPSGSKTEIKPTEEDEDVKIVENLNEYQLNDDWESDWESGDDQEVTVVKSKEFKKLIKASDLNPAMAYMLEHSGLSQEEILCIIEQSRNKSEEAFDRLSKLGGNGDEKPPFDDKDIVVKEENPEPKVVNDVSNGPSDEEEDSLSLETKPADSLGEKLPDIEKAEETAAAIISDSESDDFVEVDDVPLPVEASFNKTVKPVLEIAIVPDTTLEEDLFADVFAEGEAEETPPVAEEIPETLVEDEKSSIEDRKEAEEEIRETLDVEDEKSSIEDREEAEEALGGDDATESADLVEETNDAEEPGPSGQRNEEKKEENKEREGLKLPVGREELLTMQVQLEKEEKELSGNLGRLERQATDITDQMRMEAQELLRLFGIPYIIAPMEAEAQCAYLETINLTEGTITDDSDIWLFGGRCVYKNFFNLNKHVLQFLSTDIRHHFKLSREQMVQLALLVGSDYTIGVSGIGPVTALEILGAFPATEGDILRGLTGFRTWINSGRVAGPGRTSLRTKLRNVRIERGFPSEAVAQAYLAPAVDDSREGFTWNKPSEVMLADFAREKFGWTKKKFEVIFNPIIKRQSEPGKQKGIDSYFKIKISHKSIEDNLSKRVQKAVRQLGDDPEELETEGKTKRRNKARLEAVVEEGEKGSVMDQTQSCSRGKLGEASVAAEFIPQREKDKANALKKKLRAIEVFRKSKKGPGSTKRAKRSTCKIKDEAELSESSDSS